MVTQFKNKHSLSETDLLDTKYSMNSPFSIRLKSAIEQKFRRGEIQYLKHPSKVGSIVSSTLSKEKLQTPALLIHTRRFMVPHITYDMLEKLNLRSSFLHANTETCILALPESINGGLVSLAKPLSKYFTIWSVFDAMALDTHLLKHGQSYIQIRTERGLHKLTSENYMKTAIQWHPDCITSLAAPAIVEEKSSAQAQRLYKKWCTMLEQCIKHNSETGIPLLATLTSSNSDYLQKSVEKISEHLDEIHGVVINTSSPEITNIAKTLPTSLPRINIASMTPDEILRNLEHTDVFSTSFCHILADTGYALNLNLDECYHSSFLEIVSENFRTEKKSLSLDNHCPCWTCTHHNAAYVHHLLNCHEMLGLTLLSIHNLVQFDLFFESIRNSIDMGCMQKKIETFLEFFDKNMKSTQDFILSEFFKSSSNGESKFTEMKTNLD
ncbi:hypothetical protein HMI54_001604 [Coelomomyces lativittatus]|nr:hypothetical protein HMI56_002658 [Coelomomyces lativittatus]KAJ1506839.1 hypothetical protein HMI55_001011 [Coelomomyces lativittatus]KAJ1510418.1 hypothetical protein HMI54_001604 [Coelomomyces lativittatus]